MENHRALVIDDEVTIRRLLVRLLERRGFRVVEVDNAEAALAAAAEAPVEVVVCDVRMPVVNGMELYRRLIAHDQGLARRFVFMTGDSGAIVPEHEFKHVPVLAKPFSGSDLDAVLARINPDATPRPQP